MKERLVEHRQKEKASYVGLVDKGPMYNDKEVERQKREAEAAKRLKEEEEQWGKGNEKRKAEGKDEQTLEQWRKDKKGVSELRACASRASSLCRAAKGWASSKGLDSGAQ